MNPPDLTSVEQYEAEGYLVFENLLSAGHVETLRGRMEDIAEGRVPEFPLSDIEFEPEVRTNQRPAVRKINRCAENDAIFFEHAKHEQILAIVESLIGPDIKLFGSQCFMKPPGGVEKPYHQDSAYFSIEPADLVTCWTALDDVTLDNGCLWVIPGSHRRGLVNHSVWKIGGRDDKQVPDEFLDRTQERPIVMAAGSCSFHHSVLLHKSGGNDSDRSRRGLAVHYMSARSRWMDPETAKPEYRLLKGREFEGCV